MQIDPDVHSVADHFHLLVLSCGITVLNVVPHLLGQVAVLHGEVGIVKGNAVLVLVALVLGRTCPGGQIDVLGNGSQQLHQPALVLSDGLIVPEAALIQGHHRAVGPILQVAGKPGNVVDLEIDLVIPGVLSQLEEVCQVLLTAACRGLQGVGAVRAADPVQLPDI